MKAEWFEKLYPKVKRTFPPPFPMKMGETYKVTFNEKNPRIVPIGRGRETAVIEIKHKGKLYSLYLSHVDLARQVANLEERLGSLMNITILITKKHMKGRSFRYSLEEA